LYANGEIIMLLSKLIDKCPEKYREDLTGGLFFGLVAGLAGALAGGLVAGLAAGLAGGLFFGLVAGLAGGLVAGLVAGLAGGLVAGLVSGFIEIINSMEQLIIIVILILFISEVLYWLDKHRWDDLGRWSNTFLKKGECLFETSLIVVNIRNVLFHYQDVIDFFSSQQETVHMVLSVVGYGTIIVLLIVGYIWLNSLKYKEDKKE